MAKVSVIIPCYNHGQYIDEAVQSVLDQSYQDFEIIVVNDGSTDEYTNKLLSDYLKPKTTVIKTEYKGLHSARNTAISAAKGEYILPLDADDKIGTKFLELAVNVLDKNKKVGIVGSNVEAFGDQSWKVETKADTKRILVDNFLVATSMFRRKDWEKAGGYKTNMKYGWEDYDFWLTLLENGADIKIISEWFYYRKVNSSSNRPFSLSSMTKEMREMSFIQLFENHPKLYKENIDVLLKYINEQKFVISDLQQQLDSLNKTLDKFRNNPLYRGIKRVKRFLT